MARQSGAKGYLGFPRGLNTETSRLNPAEGTTADERNMDLDLNGLIRTRRRGLKNVGTDQATDGSIIGSYYWDSADTIVIVALKGEDPETYDTITIYLYEGDLTYIEEWTVRVVDGNAVYPSFSEIRNRLVITFGAKPFIFARKGDCFDAWTLDLFFRDFKLLDDGLRIGEHPTTLTDEHEYNLYNAGWWKDQEVDGGPATDPVQFYFNETGEYPSNAQIVYLGKVPDSTTGVLEFNALQLQSIDVGNTEAPRGHYVYNIREIDRDSKLTDKEDDGTPTSTITQVLDCSTNISGNSGNLLYQDGTPTGESSDPAPPSGGGGTGGGTGGGGGGADPTSPIYWEEK